MAIFKSRSVNINKFNLTKNLLQYLVGGILYFVLFNNFSWGFILGLVGFLIAYHSVYQFNDLMDYKEDKKNKFKLKTKSLVRGEISREDVESYSFLFVVIGLCICFFVNRLFGLLVTIILFLNFLHSSSFIKLKKSKLLIPNLFVIEFIKYSLGWFALTSSLLDFPFFLILSFSLVYVIGYIYWKQNIRHFFRSKKTLWLASLASVFYIISLLIYPFKLALLIPLPIATAFIIFKRFGSSFIRLKIGYLILFSVGICFILSMLLLITPSIAELNNKIRNKFDVIKENITNVIPKDVRYQINKVIDEQIESIDQWVKEFNELEVR